MYTSRVFKTLLIPGATLVTEEKFQQKDKNKSKLCRSSELPIYVNEAAPLAEEPEKTLPAVPSYIEEGFGTVRQHVTRVYDEAKAYQRVGVDYLSQTRDNAEWLVQYLRQEDNITPKAGAISIGGLTGLIFGLRGGLIKRAIYTATGALTMAALCYPKEASEYSQIAIAESRKYATIAYNFAYGVKKDDPPLELPSLPKLPSSLSEAWDTVHKSASSLVSGNEGDKQVTAAEHNVQVGDETIDAQATVAKIHVESIERACHCPVGACLGHHDEDNAK